ncbi:alpha/beta hydrolase [Streptacidiphilus sp. PB12-B1b]|uniref:alpha/beta fold hydrolase n=1 Tax=Streptacidiphilus sp. PB12-B1b TaxID=2705012 RepID=UPI0015FC635A|nr:alpha/beta hydrolase [Streptacidiphilus sp. PB12-B1b]QMU77246.1 alpha/beta hydrolase [Streptacidiphilus sp. PB12-B1b]QMU77258.1 alpha/beta hydrolase [Streptacidiphilus sp. PB12-B1b]
MTAPTSTGTTRTLDLPNGLSLTVQEDGADSRGSGVLLLHGGAGPRSVAGLAAALSEHVYALTPTHPGFQGTPRPPWCDTVADLAVAYLDLLDALDLTGVMVVGSSIGGWIAAEMALRDTRGRIGALTLLNAVGIHTEAAEEPVVDVRTLTPAQISRLSFADPALRPDFASFSDAQRAATGANQAALATYAGAGFSHDPKLRGRLHRVTVPVLVAWGEQDGIAGPAYGRAYADAFPHGRFVPVPGAGHFPHIEQPGPTLGAIGTFVDTAVKPNHAA